MQQQLQRHGSMEPLNDQNAQVAGSVVDQNLIRQKNCILWLLCFCFLFCTIYLQALCMIPGLQVCSMSGIEAPVPFQQSIIAYYFFTLLFLYTIYYALENVKHSIVVFIRWPLLLYSLAAIIIGVVSIIQSYSLTTDDIQEGWNKMTQWRKQQYYDSSSTNLLDENKRNLILISVYHFIYGFVFIILFGLLFNYQTIMPQNWRPPFSSRPLQKQSLIYKEGMNDQVMQPKQDDEENQEKQQDKPFQNYNQSEIKQQQQQPIDQQPSTIFQKKNTGRRAFGKQVQNSQVQLQSQQQSQLQQSQIPPQPNTKQDQPEEEANQQPF
ncbi:unnamed protein product [Paramecium primaurelia]|uniref:Transmembrane protein n=1 Tax=Paramecium primaurelia TaxID=5886 RepID=A0A8S1NDM1_PARPR|nr:unnamed protein product [Paramecium primaurelia]